MKVYNCTDLLLEVNSCNMNFRDFHCLTLNLDNVKLCYEIIINKLKEVCPINTNLNVLDFENKDVEILALLGLTELGCSFILNGKKFELSFAYAVPIQRDPFLKIYTINNLEICLKNHQIVFLPSESLYIVNYVNQKALEQLHWQERRTIGKNRNTEIVSMDFSQDFFSFWKRYVKDRYNEVQSDEFVSFFKHVYSQKSFKLYAYICKSKIVAYNVCYYSNAQKILYDVLFPWKKNSCAYRIGIYSIIKNLETANMLGWGYSLCYGNFPYKDAIFKHLWNL